MADEPVSGGETGRPFKFLVPFLFVPFSVLFQVFQEVFYGFVSSRGLFDAELASAALEAMLALCHQWLAKRQPRSELLNWLGEDVLRPRLKCFWFKDVRKKLLLSLCVCSGSMPWP